METEKLILVRQFCISHEIEVSFIESLQEYGLVEIQVIGEERYVHEAFLTDIEKLVRLHYELQINMEGLDVISALLRKIDVLQKESNTLKNRLDSYEKR